MRAFLAIWFGQLVSLTGSTLTGFALGVWVYQRTGSITQFALISLVTILPGVIVSPLAGALVDRWDRRWVMILSDSGAGLCTLAMALLLFTDSLQIWHIYVAMGTSSAFSALQWPAYTAAIPLLVPKQHLGRANGLVQVSDAVGRILAPALGGVLLTFVGIHGVILVDFATFLFAVSMLLVVRIPKPQACNESEAGQGSLISEVTYGWKYIWQRQGLFALLVFFAITNFMIMACYVLATPLVLAFASATSLGTVLSISGSGMLMGGLLASVWGGPRNKIYGVLGFELLCGVCVAIAGLRPSLTLITVAGFLVALSVPVVDSCNNTIWQSKVAPEVQGRVFSVMRMISWSCMPLAFVVAGPLADYVFEPLLAVNGTLANSVGRIIGIGQGRGIGFLYMILGSGIVLTVIFGFLYPRLRLMEQELPDVLGKGQSTDITLAGEFTAESVLIAS